MKLPLMIQVTLLDLMELSRVGQWFHVNQVSVLQFVYITYRIQCSALYTHTHTCAYIAGECTKASTNMHNKQAL